MTHYTGMGPGTINHFQHVGAQLNAHINNMGGQNLHPVHGQMFQTPLVVQPAYASNFSNGIHPGGYNGVNNDQIGDFGRAFMRNLFR